jgi:hypothetical protein
MQSLGFIKKPKMRPLKNVKFGSSSRKREILTIGLHDVF